MNEQIRWITNVLNEASVENWIESGTLLSYIRDGELTEYDDDIDIGVWASDSKTIDGLRDEFQRKGYKIQTRSYRGKTHKYKFIPSSSSSRTIDLQLFRRTETHAWIPLSVVNGSGNLPIFGHIFDLLEPLIRRYARATSGHVEIDEGMKSYPIDIITLYIPMKYLENLQYNEEFDLYTPQYLEEYLCLRYGDWKTPVEKWELVYDGGIRVCEPSELINDL